MVAGTRFHPKLRPAINQYLITSFAACMSAFFTLTWPCLRWQGLRPGYNQHQQHGGHDLHDDALTLELLPEKERPARRRARSNATVF